MLKRISSLVLVLGVAGSVFAGNVRLGSEHICKMLVIPNMAYVRGMRMTDRADKSRMAARDMETDSGSMSCDMEHMSDMDAPESESVSTEMTGMEAMPCCEDRTEAATELTNVGECCVTDSHDPSSIGTTSSLRPTYSSISITHPAVTQPLVFLPSRGKRPFVTQQFSPDFQASYIRNLSFLI